MVKTIITFFKKLPLWVFLYDNFGAILRMVQAYVRGEFKISQKTLAKIAFGTFYLVFIIDLIPDFLFFFGYLDDIAVLSWVMNSIKGDIEKFIAWEGAKAIQ